MVFRIWRLLFWGKTLEGYANINLKSTSENADVREAEVRLLCETRENSFILQAELHLFTEKFH